MHTNRLLLVALILTMSAAALPSAQQRFQAVGPNECLNCHDHENERSWYEKREIPEVQKLFPEKGANAGHINSLKQLEAPKSNEFAKAIGLADKYDLNGACVRCHATVFAGDANAGVSCESCHGPASGYLKPHQTKGAYEQSVAQFGMTRLVGNIQAWTQQCTTCHVMDDQRLIAAGHPSGDDFDLGRKYTPVALHFKKQYAAADISAIGRSEFEAIIRKRRGITAPAAAAAPPAAPPTVAAAPPPPPAPEPPPQAPAATSTPSTQPPAPAAPPAPPPSARADAPARTTTPPPVAVTPPPASADRFGAATPAEAPNPLASAPTSPAAPQLPPPIPAVTTVSGGRFVQNNWPWLLPVVVIPVALIFWWLGRRNRGR